MSNVYQTTLQPHGDIELDWKRGPLELYATLPKQGINEETGILFIVDDFDGYANSVYQSTEVRPYLADRYNFIVAGVNYFGIHRRGVLDFRTNFVHNLNQIYGLGVNLESLSKMQSAGEFFRDIAEALAQRGITRLDLRCQPAMLDGKGEYQSWGLLPALDGLQCVGHLMKQYPSLNMGRIVAYGHQYGGYVAGLMAKFAPHTFSVVIDKDGYVKAEMAQIAAGEWLEPALTMEIPFYDFPLPFRHSIMPETPWTLEDELSPRYFSDSHRRVRSLLVPEHHQITETRHYLLQTEEDPQDRKEIRMRYQEILKEFHPVSFEVQPQAVFGSNHQDVFDWVVKKENAKFIKEKTDTDFSLKCVHEFLCGEKDYSIAFQDDFSVKMTVKKRRRTAKAVKAQCR